MHGYMNVKKDLFFNIMDTGSVLCDVKTDVLYVLNYSDEFLASYIRTIWFSEYIGYVDNKNCPFL